MRIAYLDCFSGISGDMFLGALVDAGVSARLLEQTVAALEIGARLEISRVDAAGLRRPRWMCLVGERRIGRGGPQEQSANTLPRPHTNRHHERTS